MHSDDEMIRSRLLAEAAWRESSVPVAVVLRELSPRLHRARRLRRLAISATGVAVLSVTTAVALRVGIADRSTTIGTSDPVESVGDVEQQSPSPIGTDGRGVTTDHGGPIPPGGPAATTTTVGTSTSSMALVPTTSLIADVPAAPIPSPATATSAPPGTTPITSVTPTIQASTPATTPVASQAPTSTTAAATTDPAWTPHHIDSACGSVDVRYRNDVVELVGVSPNPGFAVDVKDDGRETVEVGLKRGDYECELKARLVAGQLVSSVDGPSTRGPDDD